MHPPDPAVRAIRAWYRLDRAFAEASRQWKAEHGVSGLQVAMLRIVGEHETWPLSELRARLSMHPATLGQTLERLADRGLLTMTHDEADKRRRTVALTDQGRELIAALPLIGPVRLRTAPAPPEALERLATAFDEALDLFGLTPYAPPADGPPAARKEQQ